MEVPDISQEGISGFLFIAMTLLIGKLLESIDSIFSYNNAFIEYDLEEEIIPPGGIVLCVKEYGDFIDVLYNQQVYTVSRDSFKLAKRR
jgi:hypothetical protein